jgi:hypothetical protein
MNDTAYLTAFAALAGSTILTSLASAWLTQRRQDRAKRRLQDKGRRQSLYKQFVNEASKLYADALSDDKSDNFGVGQRVRSDRPNANRVQPRRGRKGGDR